MPPTQQGPSIRFAPAVVDARLNGQRARGGIEQAPDSPSLATHVLTRMRGSLLTVLGRPHLRV